MQKPMNFSIFGQTSDKRKKIPKTKEIGVVLGEKSKKIGYRENENLLYTQQMGERYMALRSSHYLQIPVSNAGFKA